MTLTFLDDIFLPRPKRISTVPQKGEYHGIASAIGKLSKRINSLEAIVNDKPAVPQLKKELTPPPSITTPVIVPVNPTEEVTKENANAKAS